MALVHSGHAGARATTALWAPVLLWTAAAALVVIPVAPALQLQALLVGVALTGAPHGVLDIDQAVWATRRRGGVGRLLMFLATYLLLVGVGLAGWRWAPGATLVAFLLAAAWHFGADEDGDEEAIGPRSASGGRARLILTAARGGAVILPAAALHPAQTTPLFAALAGASPASVEAVAHAALPALCAVWAALLVAALAGLVREARRRAAAELLGLAVLFALAPPLAAFTVYFCGVHAVRHASAVAARSGARRPLAWLAVRLVPAALVSGLVLAALAAHGGLDDAVVWSFRLLAALTLPHLVFGPALERARPDGADGRAPRAWTRHGAGVTFAARSIR